MFANIVDMKEIVQIFLHLMLRAGPQALKSLIFRPHFCTILLGLLKNSNVSKPRMALKMSLYCAQIFFKLSMAASQTTV